MQKIFKGCFVAVASIVGLILLSSAALIFYWLSPNGIEFTEKPINKEKYINQLSFPGSPLPTIVINANETDILYQAFVRDEGFDMTVIFKTVIRVEKVGKFGSRLPISKTVEEAINNKLAFNTIDGYVFKPQIKIPEDKKTNSGRHLIVYAPKDEIFMKLKNGRYDSNYESVDKIGYIYEVILYDRDNQLLYYERQRYHALQ